MENKITQEEFKIISKDCPWHGRVNNCIALKGRFCSIKNCAIIYWLSVHVIEVKDFINDNEK